MDRVLDLDRQPPYVEVYQHAPLMYLTICDFDLECHWVAPQDWIFWCHQVHTCIETIATASGLYKIKAMSQGSSCLFVISPDMPPREQATLMVSCARQMLAQLRQVTTPFGRPLAVQITLHAGEYAGGIIGSSAWTYDLFGEHVSAIQAMDQHNSTNQIQVSEAALRLLSDGAHVTPTYVLAGGKGTRYQMYRVEAPLAPLAEAPVEASGATAATPSAAAATVTPPVPVPTASPRQQLQPPNPALPPSPEQPAAMGAAAFPPRPSAPAAAKPADACAPPVAPEAGAKPPSALAASGAAPVSGERWGMAFANGAMERAYARHHNANLVRLDVLFVVVSLLLAGSCMVGPIVPGGVCAGSGGLLASSAVCYWRHLSGGLVLHTALGYGLPVAAGLLMALAPTVFVAWREQLWTAHRVLNVVNLCSHAVLYAAPPGGGALDFLRMAVVVMLMNSLGFKVRYRAHCLVTMLNVATCLVAVAHATAAHSAQARHVGAVGTWLTMAVAVPTVLVYHWEREHRGEFLVHLTPGASPSGKKAKVA